ncbi:hypothetical protein A2344_05900 [Candidatus Peregrinibacteria bacterium RIFOXYB12_FULL_41_12]|nr:MAG: hypothetical protein A2244_03990 [Candidatus Peregrinibacteria bacterium RIFOXYA2_FULL_41_18]OGJ49085.1 MAG: hypothetical protein A2344_05900 [Candidatus Peregrinibacteria bacterium RIFOXYB12_FULL_41_12]OGJ52914.1 MAG: hypothetical protein A2336_04895 [Candidatus Peregrinibacteria bacterium RIFOXYB2_FULL_41_88]OGJ53541.1 MAG: hypothetical protein A2448_04470 [Candidatus Peregrinibacteria bacterium RIFOXYC2_FULL_41_22]
MDLSFNLNSDNELVVEAVAKPSGDLFLGTLEEFQKLIKTLNRKAKDEAEYVFQNMEKDFWVLQEDYHDSDEFDCAIFRVVKGEVYALSHDVLNFLNKIRNKFRV